MTEKKVSLAERRVLRVRWRVCEKVRMDEENKKGERNLHPSEIISIPKIISYR